MNNNPKNIAVIGASGALGQAFVNLLANKEDTNMIYAFSRSKVDFASKKIRCATIDVEDENSIEAAAKSVQEPLDMIIVAIGILHNDDIQPEKALKNLSAEKFHKVFAVNSIGPALIMKHFLPLLAKDKTSVFAALSARVGSIADDMLGGWYAYRASKAALNMLIKNASIEVNRIKKQTIIVGLHPGTVNSQLSAPFQKNVPPEQLFEPEHAAEKLLNVLNRLTPNDSGGFFAYDGESLPY